MIITHRMQDKAMRAISDYCANYPSHVISKEFLVYKEICDEANAQHLIDVLCALQLITYNLEDDMRVIRLTPDGKKYFEERADVIHERRITNIKYIITTTIAVAALIIAAVSLLAQLGLIRLPHLQ